MGWCTTVSGDIGDQLVMAFNAIPPNRCVKTNRPTNGSRFTKKFVWYSRAAQFWIAFWVLLCFPVAIIVDHRMRKTAIVEVGISSEILKRRWRNIIVALGMALGSCVFIFLSANPQLVPSSLAPEAVLLLGILLLPASLLWGVIGARIVRVAKIDGNYIWLNGVCEEFLNQFPNWTAGR